MRTTDLMYTYRVRIELGNVFCEAGERLVAAFIASRPLARRVAEALEAGRGPKQALSLLGVPGL